jgi:hypothetical protein
MGEVDFDDSLLARMTAPGTGTAAKFLFFGFIFLFIVRLAAI